MSVFVRLDDLSIGRESHHSERNRVLNSYSLALGIPVYLVRSSFLCGMILGMAKMALCSKYFPDQPVTHVLQG